MFRLSNISQASHLTLKRTLLELFLVQKFFHQLELILQRQ